MAKVEIFRLFGKILLNDTEARRGLENLDKKAAGVGQSFDQVIAKVGKFGQATAKVGASLTKTLSLPLLGLGIAAGKLSIDFETSLAKIVGLVGVAQEQVSEWGEEILALAPAFGKAPAELADAMFFITSAGLRGEEAMDVLIASAKAASAGLGETKVVADLVTSAVNAYGSGNLSAAKATDILVAAVREGKAEAPDLASSLGKVLPVASEMGVTFDQVGAAVAAMTRTGTDAATASTQLSAIMAGLLKPASQAEEALMAMGTSSAELRRTIREDGLLTALMDIRELTSQYGEEVMATVFPNIRALRGILDLMGANVEENAAIFDRMADSTGSLDHAFETISKTAGFMLKQALVEVQATLTTLGDAVLPVVVPLIQEGAAAVARFAVWFRSLSAEQGENIVKWGLFLIALGPALFVVGKAIAGFAGLIKGIRAVGVALQFLALNPVGAVIVGIAALVGILLLAPKHFDGAGKAAADMGEKYRVAAKSVKNLADAEWEAAENAALAADLQSRRAGQLELGRLREEKEVLAALKQQADTEAAAEAEMEKYLVGVNDLITGFDNAVSSATELAKAIELTTTEIRKLSAEAEEAYAPVTALFLRVAEKGGMGLDLAAAWAWMPGGVAAGLSEEQKAGLWAAWKKTYSEVASTDPWLKSSFKAQYGFTPPTGHEGGQFVVPGGGEGLALLQSGEFILPEAAAGGMVFHMTIENHFTGTQNAGEVADTIASGIAGRLARKMREYGVATA